MYSIAIALAGSLYKVSSTALLTVSASVWMRCFDCFSPGQVRQKQAAIRALEEEREQCLDLERRLHTEMRCGRRAMDAAARAEDSGGGGGGSDDGGKMLNDRRSRRLRGCASDDEREVY